MRFTAGLLALLCATAWAASPGLRQQEIDTCLPGEISTWGDGVDRPALSNPLLFVYEHLHAPAVFTQAQVRRSLQQALTAWSACGVEGRLLEAGSAAGKSTVIRIGWQDVQGGSHFGQADLRQRQLILGPQAFLAVQRHVAGADMPGMLQLVLSHEIGHFYGLMAHSRRCVDVTSYRRNAQGAACFTRDGHHPVTEYRSFFPTACEIARCKAINAR
jgi:hypothetical protein